MDKIISKKCEKIKLDASIKLMELTVQACEKGIAGMSERIDSLEATESEDVIHDANVYYERERHRLEKVKKGKINRLLCKDTVVGERNVKGDGNCFYRCMSVAIYGTEDLHSEVRQEICDYMSHHREKFECFTDCSIDQHIRNQRKMDGSINSWATEADIYAAAARYETNIKITMNKDKPQWHNHVLRINDDGTEETSTPSKRSIHLLLSNNHFTVLYVHQDDAVPTLKDPALACSTTQNETVDWFEMTQSSAQNSTEGAKPEAEVDPKPEVLKVVHDPESDSYEVVGETIYLAGENESKSGRIKPQKSMSGREHGKKRFKLKDKGDKNMGGDTGVKAEFDHINSNQDVVTNLSKYKLTREEISLLSKGIKFIPDKTKVNKVRLLADLNEWERRMRLREYFYGEEKNNEETDHTLDEKFRLKKKSRFTPNKGRDMWLDLYIETVKRDIVSNLKRSGKLNLTKQEQSAFQSLLDNDAIVIRPADKGSGVVVIDKLDYVSKLEREIESSASYETTHSDRTQDSLKSVRKLANNMLKEGAICKDMYQYLVPRYPKAGSLKGNPKIHKSGAPMRTIVSGINTPTEQFAEVAEHELNQYVESSPSFIRDTTDFINRLRQIEEPLPENAILFTFDVEKLYPSVPREEGLAACQQALEMRAKPLIPTHFVIEMIRTVLDNNNFNFGDRNFLQTDGVAIGSRLGKNFACSYMRTWDEKLLEFPKSPLFYKRFIDDGFGIWTGSVDDLLDFGKHANNIHQNIKIEMKWSEEKIEFLDTLVKIQNGRIITDLYQKPTDKQLYIRHDSCHPSHTKKNLPYGLGLRLKRICTREEDYKRHRNELKSQLRKRGYSGKKIEQQLQRVDQLKREDLLQKNPNKKAGDRVPLVVTFSKQLPDITNILQKHHSILENSERLQAAFKQPPLVAYRRDTNICDSLIHMKTNRLIKKETPCMCVFCQKIIRSDIPSADRKDTHKVIKEARCTDRNIIYGIKCTKCDRAIYVGETERTLKERIGEHLRDIKNSNEKPINSHFENHNAKDIEYAVLQKLGHNGRAMRLLVEDIWIRKLNTLAPCGCNVQRNR
ncbi:hypothetical protein FSP39_007586 [Pinctada imbricata]|uniref:OTU domain-containing protein n=1 Tax=Pinctada imbricata TaxID=66713 RepID=A0AA88XWW8_PINIB|nr:hypothetical protein FSP39_007586 [Pinctada imbricata]